MSGVIALLAPRTRGLYNRWRRASVPERWTIAFFALLGLGFWAGLFGLFGWLVDAFHQVEVFGPILSRKLLEVLTLGLFSLLCFSNVISALSTFYLSDDLELVLSLPVSRETFFYARLIDTITQSSWMLLFFGAPVWAAYHYAYGAGWEYPTALMVVLPGFVLIPAALGVTVASLLVRGFPARRIREAMAVAGIVLLVVAFVGLRVVRPERLVEADSFESVAAYVANLQAPVPLLAPPRWVSDVLVATLMGRPTPWLALGLLISGAVAATAVARWVTASVYDEGRARAQEARAARLAHAGWLDRVLSVWTRPLSPVTRAIVVKDVKSFVRDASQWSQLLLVGSIVIISLTSVAALPLDIFKGPSATLWRDVLAVLAHLMVGFVMAAVAARFQFTAVSTEHRAFWVVRTAPITAEQLLWAKVWPSLVPMIVVGEILGVATSVILGADGFMIALSAVTVLGLAFGISGIAVGQGAIWPDFKADNAARVASGPAGILFMVSALSLVFVVVLLEAIPTWIWLSSRWQGESLGAVQWLAVVLSVAGALAVCAVATVWPIRRGAAALWRRELPNS